MNKVQLTGAALAVGVAAMFSTVPVFADDAATGSAASSAPMVNCVGVNSCKGQSACKTANNACKGQNACKGKGVMSMTQDDCTKAGGTVMSNDTGSDSSSSAAQ